MTRMLIVDDEQGQVKELVEIVRAIRPDFEVKGVNSGMEALALAQRESFDCMITDIRMPQMDGLELIRRMLPLGNEMMFVILSGYGDFQYAKKAIEFGVMEYLVKPVSKRGLMQLFERIDKMMGEKKSRKEDRENLQQQLEQSMPVYMEHLLNKWVLGEMNDDELHEITGMLPDLGAGIVGVCQFEKSARMSGKEQAVAWLTETLQRIGSTIVFSLASNGNRSVFVLHATSHDLPGPDRWIKAIRSVLDRIEDELQIGCSFGISEPSDHIFSEIHTRFDQSIQAIEYRFFSGDERCILYESIRAQPVIKQLNLYELENQLMVELNRGNLATIYGILNETFEQFRRSAPRLRPDQVKEYCVYVALNLAEKANLNMAEDELKGLKDKYASLLYDSEKSESLRRNMKAVMDELVGLCADRETDKNERLIRQCQQYIEQHYGDDRLSLETVAGKFYFNPSYLSNLFKTYAGIGYSEYVTKVRIERAQALLEHSDKKIYEISSEVGYNDSTYFIKLFKKETGMSPNKFKKLHRAK